MRISDRITTSVCAALVISLAFADAFAGVEDGGQNAHSPLMLFDSIALGPIETIALSSQHHATTVTILGQSYGTNVSVGAVGDYVLAAGVGGSLIMLATLAGDYVAGASPVFVRGAAREVDSSLAELTIGNLVVSYGDSLVADPSLSPQSGGLIEGFGIQPAFGGKLLGQKVKTSTVVLGITGGDISSVLGINGGDKHRE